MAELVFEIWEDSDNGSSEMSLVSQQHDSQRKKVSPDAVLRHSFTASSYFEAAQKNYDFHGWGKYRSVEGMDDIVFTDEEAKEQRRYLSARE